MKNKQVTVQGPVKKPQMDCMSHRGGSEAKKRVCVSETRVKFPASLIVFVFLLRKLFLVWVGGWVGRARAGQGPKPHPPLWGGVPHRRFGMTAWTQVANCRRE